MATMADVGEIVVYAECENTGGPFGLDFRPAVINSVNTDGTVRLSVLMWGEGTYGVDAAESIPPALGCWTRRADVVWPE